MDAFRQSFRKSFSHAPFWIYALFLCVLSARHEVWRDEVGRFFIVTQGGSLRERLYELSTYGHPLVWDLVLFAFDLILRSPLTIKLAQVASALWMSWLFWRHSPFRPYEKILFLAGYFPLFEYGVISRNYSISMALIFLLCHWHEGRFSRWLRYCFVLFLLAQTHGISLVCAAAFLSAAIAERFIGKNGLRGISHRRFAAGVLIAVAGMGLAVLEARPLPSTRDGYFHQTGLRTKALAALRAPVTAHIANERLAKTLALPSKVAASAVLVAVGVVLWRHWAILWIWLASLMGIRFFFEVAREGAIRHYGFIYFMILASLWLLRRRRGKWARSSGMLLGALLLLQVIPAWKAVRADWSGRFSGSRYAADVIRARPDLSKAIIMGEPDGYVEALSYYLPNRIYFPREERFGFSARFDDRVKAYEYSLGRLLNEAKRVKHRHGVPVVLFIGYHEEFSRANETHRFYHGKTFRVTEHSYDLLMKHARQIGDVSGTMKKEDYRIFVLR